ncbi:MAG: 7-cyano-7-deazaguanine synthase QueC [Beijerinckiaceae bacterium]|nr:7-cyano-7-deazaguanine synthase QueC [Beijerinckiaceae bacterium]
MSEAALVLFSGGQDSTTCLAWALDRYERVETVGFNYGQRHAIEMECRQDVLAAIRSQFPHWATRLGPDLVVDVPTLGTISETSLTREAEFRMQADGLPNSFVPGRNLVFLTFAAAVAYRRDIKRIVTGVCETDYSGYPDCRDDTMKAMQVALSLGLERRLVIETPLMWVDKPRTWNLAESLGGPTLVELVRTRTHSCYMGDRSHEHDWGYGCGACPACDLRRAGWMAFRAQTKAR